jgi:hypothetical protein
MLATRLFVEMVGGAAYVMACPLAVCAELNEPQLVEGGQGKDQSTPALVGSLDTTAVIVAVPLM